MQIRLLTKYDIAVWKTIRLKALSEHPTSFGSSYAEESIYSDEEWKRGLETRHIFGAFINEELIGTVGFYIFNRLKTKHRALLFAVYTLPTYRRQGVAHALIKTAISYAKSQVSQLHLSCVTTNTSTVKFYEKYGFEIYGTEPNALKVDEQFFDEHLMVLKFDPINMTEIQKS